MRTVIGFFWAVMVIGLIVRLIWWILGAVALYLLFRVVRSQLRAARATRERDSRRAAQIAARADEQHRWVLQGDDRGVYGVYPPAGLPRSTRRRAGT